jgi:hypothetical protein
MKNGCNSVVHKAVDRLQVRSNRLLTATELYGVVFIGKCGWAGGENGILARAKGDAKVDACFSMSHIFIKNVI